ncbi:SPOR domain-containing protein [Sphingosinicella sp.]|uniref:SPOR domain-containing protein n=1 Tax=Sphingosinicella sp. TaxID=1917971 RepID=UPI00403776B2
MPRRRGDEDEIELTEAERIDDDADRADEDRLPWLEAVEEDGDGDGPSLAKLLAALIIGLLAIGLIVGGLFWLGNRNRPGGNGEIIAAPEGDYKVRPVDPGGMNVQGEGDTAIAASEGAQPQGQIDTNRLAEAPVARQGAGPVSQQGGQSSATQNGQTAPARPAPTQPARPAPAAGPTVQLGAFSSEAAANRAWTALSARFRYLAPLSHGIVPVRSGDRTLYRLRASGPGAVDICRRLQAAGETCAPVS